MMKRPVILSCRLSTTAIILLQSLIQDAMTCPVEQYADTAATFLGFDRKTVPGNITTLEQLITGTQDFNILTLAPGEKIHQMLFEC